MQKSVKWAYNQELHSEFLSQIAPYIRELRLKDCTALENLSRDQEPRFEPKPQTPVSSRRLEASKSTTARLTLSGLLSTSTWQATSSRVQSFGCIICLKGEAVVIVAFARHNLKTLAQYFSVTQAFLSSHQQRHYLRTLPIIQNGNQYLLFTDLSARRTRTRGGLGQSTASR